MLFIHARRRCSSALLKRSLTPRAASVQSSSSEATLPGSLPLQEHPQCRWSSSGSSGKPGPQPRRRFYKQVGVTEVPSPWKNRAEMELKKTSARETNGADAAAAIVDNPISAGVDGTQSASGVRHLPDFSQENKSELELFRERLIPRCTTLDTKDRGESAEPSQWYSVTLDGRTLRTPAGQILSVPSQMLAWAIATEWDAQTTQIKPVQMPLMTLCCTALDQTAFHMEHYQSEALKFLPTDTTCYWADPTEDRVLYRQQEAAWKELHEFVEQELNHKPAMAMGAQEGMLMSKRDAVTGQRGLPHPPSLYEACAEWTRKLDAWHLTALNSMASETKSFLVAFATLHPSSPFSTFASAGNGKDDALAKAIRAARVEEEFQIESWGLVEGQHDYDRLNCSVQVRSSNLLAKCVLDQSY